MSVRVASVAPVTPHETVQLLFADRSNVVQLIVMVRDVGTFPFNCVWIALVTPFT